MKGPPKETPAERVARLRNRLALLRGDLQAERGRRGRYARDRRELLGKELLEVNNELAEAERELQGERKETMECRGER